MKKLLTNTTKCSIIISEERKDLKTLKRKLEKEGYKIDYDRYAYWDLLPYVYNKETNTKTFLVIDLYGERGYTVIQLEGGYRTYEQILECIKGGYKNLGVIDDDRKGFGVKKNFMPWEVEEYGCY